MKINNEYVVKKIAGDYVLIHQSVSEVDFSKIITLNEIGLIIYDSIKDNITKDEIVKRITDEYDVDVKTATSDVNDFIKKLVELKIIYED